MFPDSLHIPVMLLAATVEMRMQNVKRRLDPRDKQGITVVLMWMQTYKWVQRTWKIFKRPLLHCSLVQPNRKRQKIRDYLVAYILQFAERHD